MNNGYGIVQEQYNVSCIDCTVSRCSVLRNCSEQCLNLITFLKKTITFKKGQRIILEGNYSQNIFLLSSGKIKIYKTDKEGNDLILRFVKKGEILDFNRLNSNNEYEESAMAIDDCVLCLIDQEDFFRVVQVYPELANELLSYYQNALIKAENKSFRMGRLKVKGRVADALLTMYEAYGTSGGEHTLNLELSRREIADLACTTKEQVSTILSEFSDCGIIETHAKQINLRDIDALKAVAEV